MSAVTPDVWCFRCGKNSGIPLVGGRRVCLGCLTYSGLRSLEEARLKRAEVAAKDGGAANACWRAANPDLVTIRAEQDAALEAAAVHLRLRDIFDDHPTQEQVFADGLTAAETALRRLETAKGAVTLLLFGLEHEVDQAARDPLRPQKYHCPLCGAGDES